MAPERPARVLLVEDDEDIRALFSATLHRAGSQPRTASSGQQALAAAE